MWRSDGCSLASTDIPASLACYPSRHGAPSAMGYGEGWRGRVKCTMMWQWFPLTTNSDEVASRKQTTPILLQEFRHILCAARCLLKEIDEWIDQPRPMTIWCVFSESGLCCSICDHRSDSHLKQFLHRKRLHSNNFYIVKGCTRCISKLRC
jgi:hypothetical protein